MSSSNRRFLQSLLIKFSVKILSYYRLNPTKTVQMDCIIPLTTIDESNRSLRFLGTDVSVYFYYLSNFICFDGENISVTLFIHAKPVIPFSRSSPTTALYYLLLLFFPIIIISHMLLLSQLQSSNIYMMIMSKLYGSPIIKINKNLFFICLFIFNWPCRIVFLLITIYIWLCYCSNIDQNCCVD